MKVLLLSASHPHKMAGILASDLLNGFREIDQVKVKLAVGVWDRYNDKDIIPVESFSRHFVTEKKNLVIRILKKIGLVKNKPIPYNIDYRILDFLSPKKKFSTRRILKKVAFDPDIIIVLFVQSFLSYKNFYELNKITKAPILMYMMDMATMTGGCHYAWDCKGYTLSCGSCPALYSSNPNDQTYLNLKEKKFYVEKTEIAAIACSTFSYKQLILSSLFKNKRKKMIIEPINSDLFKPGDKIASRKKLQLPVDKKIIFFGAVSIENKRKGFTKLLEALNNLDGMLTPSEKDSIYLAIAGNIKTNHNFQFPFSHTMVGYLPHNELPTLYRAADVYVCPSIEDAGPMMINQSIMCGTPVVSFDMGVAPDLVIKGATGYVAKPFDTMDLANGILEILKLKNDEYMTVSSKCRELGMNTFSNKQVAMNLIEFSKEFQNKYDQ